MLANVAAYKPRWFLGNFLAIMVRVSSKSPTVDGGRGRALRINRQSTFTTVVCLLSSRDIVVPFFTYVDIARALNGICSRLLLFVSSLWFLVSLQAVEAGACGAVGAL